MSELFNYKVRDRRTGASYAGDIEAESRDDAVSKLRARGYLVTSVEPQRKKGDIKIDFSRFKRIKLVDLVLFSRQFATLIGSGVSLIKTLKILEEQTVNSKLKKSITNISSKVESGVPLSQALDEEKQFPQLFISMIAAGEIGGNLDDVLEDMAVQFEKQSKLQRQVSTALAYPLVIVAVAAALIVFLILFVMPRFMGIFEGFDMELPAITKLIFALGENAATVLPVVLGVFLIMIGGLVYYYKKEDGRRRIDGIILKLPLIGDLATKVSIVRFSQTLGVLLGNGVSILESLEVTSKIVTNKVISEDIKASRTSISEGESIAVPLSKNKTFPQLVLQMIRVGEETGNLEGMLAKVAEFYEEQVEAKIETVVSLIEPLLIIGIGGVVGTLVVSIMLPLFSMIGNV